MHQVRAFLSTTEVCAMGEPTQGIGPTKDILPEERVWRALDVIAGRLSGIEEKLSDVIRLEERVNNHNDTLVRYGEKLETLDLRSQASQLWQSEQSNKASQVFKDVEKLKLKMESVGSLENVRKGQRDIMKEGMKIVIVILTGVIVYKFTQG